MRVQLRKFLQLAKKYRIGMHSMMVYGTLITSFVFACITAIIGVISLKQGRRSRFTFVLMALAFCAQCGFLYLRGEIRGRCPLGDWGEILVFIAWSLSIFYMVIGPTYRISLLGFFSAPIVAILTLIAMAPGILEKDPLPLGDRKIDPWGELHAALSVLSYGALLLGMVAAKMFLALNMKLKSHHLEGGLFKNLPPVTQLTNLSRRLIWVGIAILTLGILSSLMMNNFSVNNAHLWTAVGVWISYVFFMVWTEIKGLAPRTYARVCVILFFTSLIPFGLI
jgi:ABC-type uncharacterized transport system permease subunit